MVYYYYESISCGKSICFNNIKIIFSLCRCLTMEHIKREKRYKYQIKIIIKMECSCNKYFCTVLLLKWKFKTHKALTAGGISFLALTCAQLLGAHPKAPLSWASEYVSFPTSLFPLLISQIKNINFSCLLVLALILLLKLILLLLIQIFVPFLISRQGILQYSHRLLFAFLALKCLQRPVAWREHSTPGKYQWMLLGCVSGT